MFWDITNDFRSCLRDESHQSSPKTYHMVRSAYVKTHGWSRRGLRWLYRGLRAPSINYEHVNVATIDALKREGVAVVPHKLGAATVRQLAHYFRETPAHAIGEGFSKGPLVKLHDAGRTPRLAYDTRAVIEAPGVLELLADPSIQHLAAAYLGCEPIFTGANAWWSLADPAADRQALSWAAQLFHFDADWPAFVKVFFYLTDVNADDGPFTYVRGTHEAKREWRDGRFDDGYIADTYGDRVCAITGSAGDMIVADTSGYHKGERVRVGPRLMLQIEYCVSRLGAGFQYERYPRAMRPLSDFQHTFDVFCEP